MTFPHYQCADCDREAMEGGPLCSRCFIGADVSASYEVIPIELGEPLTKLSLVMERCEHCGTPTPLRVDGHACCEECVEALHPSIALAQAAAAAAAREHEDEP